MNYYDTRDNSGQVTQPKPWEQRASNRWDNRAGRAQNRANRWDDRAENARFDPISKMWSNLSGQAQGNADRRSGWSDWYGSGRQGVSPFVERAGDAVDRKEEIQDELGLRDPYDQYSDDYRDEMDRFKQQGKRYTQDYADAVGQQRGQMAGDLAKYGPMGQQYSGRENEMFSNLQRMGGKDYAGEYGGNTINFMNNLMGSLGTKPGSLGADAEGMMRSAMRGNLTAPGSEWLQNSLSARAPVVEDKLRALKESAGANRGVGGGRFTREAADLSDQSYKDIMADLSKNQMDLASQGIGYQTSKRGQDVNLANIGAGMQSQVAGNQLDANKLQSGHMLGASGQALDQNRFLAELDKAKLDANRSGDQQAMDNMFTQLGLDQNNKQMELDEPDKIEKFMSALGGIGNLTDFKWLTKLIPGLGA